MGFITRSGTALVALVGAAALYAAGALFLAAAFLALTPSDRQMAGNLTHAGNWLRFAGAVVALLAVAAAGWPIARGQVPEAAGEAKHPHRFRHGRIGRRVLVSPLGEEPPREVAPGDPPRKHPRHRAETPTEVAADALIVGGGVLLVTIGLLVTAAHGRTNEATGIIGAFGFVLLGLLLVWRSNSSLPEMVAGVATLVFSVGYAMVATATSTQGQVAAGLLEAAAAAATAAAIVAARPREYLWTGAGRVPFLRPVVGGLLLLTVAFVIAAIVSGVVYSGNATLTDIRVGPAIAYALEGVGIAMFGWAAAWRVYLANHMQHAR